jgi:hypothetical protein
MDSGQLLAGMTVLCVGQKSESLILVNSAFRGINPVKNSYKEPILQ